MSPIFYVYTTFILRIICSLHLLRDSYASIRRRSNGRWNQAYILLGSLRHNSEIGRTDPKNIFPITIDTSSGIMVLTGVVLGKLGHDREIKRTDLEAIFLFIDDMLPSTTVSTQTFRVR